MMYIIHVSQEGIMLHEGRRGAMGNGRSDIVSERGRDCHLLEYLALHLVLKENKMVIMNDLVDPLKCL